MVQAIIFDCFGVLVGQGFEHAYRIAGGDPVTDREFINDMLGQANMGLITDTDFRTAMATNLGLQLAEWQEAIKATEQPDFELLTYIKELRASYKTAILSNANTGVLEHEIGKEWLDACFDQLIVSAEIGMVKPDQRIYEHTLEKLEVQPNEAIFIDDRESFLTAAQAIGMQTILYSHYAQFKTELEALLANSER